MYNVLQIILFKNRLFLIVLTNDMTLHIIVLIVITRTYTSIHFNTKVINGFSKIKRILDFAL